MKINVCGMEVDANALRMMHDTHGPRIAYQWVTGRAGKDVTTPKVEDFAIEYYTQYNKHVCPGTY